MKFARARFTVWSTVLAAALAAVLFGIIQYVRGPDASRRQANTALQRASAQELQAQLKMNHMEQAQLRAMAQAAGRRHAGPEEMDKYRRSLEQVRQDGQSLQQKLSQVPK
jgi:catalase (peroxidase I)